MLFLNLPEKQRILKRYIIELAYSGKNYHGWQNQPNAITVQEVLEKAISTILGTDISLTGAGRTDSGVHASYFVAHFDCESHFNCGKLTHKLNRYLKKDISVFTVKETSGEFHARFEAVSRTYKYVISKKKSVFLPELAMLYTGDLDLQKMNAASSIILNTSDFTSFAKLHSDNKTSVCEIKNIGWESRGDIIVFTITADRFLRNMVRSITATLLEIGKSKLSLAELEEIINSKDNQKTPMSAPAHGLYLFDIQYPETYKLKNPVGESEFPFI